MLLPGFPNPVRLSVRVDLDEAGLPVSAVRSSLPADVNGTVITVQPGQRLDRDLVIRFDIGADVVGSSLVAYDGTFALTLVPPVRAAGPSKPRDIAFVLDRSGSMGGWKMTAARRAVARMIDTLGAADRFAVLAFDNQVETPSTLDSGLVAATDRHRFRAVEYLATLTARGGTEMLTPLQTAVALLTGDDSERQRVLVLATDGQVGNEDQILAAIGADAANIRIFTVGIDTAVNDAFLRRIAAAGGGNCELVESEDRLDEVMERIHRRIGAPVLDNIAITGIGLDIMTTSITPARIPALHEGAPLVVLGRSTGADAGTIRVSATDAGGKPWSTQVPLSGDGSSAQVAVWARARIRDLEDRYVVVGGDEAIEREIVRTSLDGHVLSRFTAFVAVDTRVVVDGGTARRITQPVDAPHGWDMFEPRADQARFRPSSIGRAAHPTSASMAPPMAAMAAPAPASDAFGAAAQRLLRKSAPRHHEQPKRAESIAVDLTPYRKRAAELSELVGRGDLDADGLRRALVDLVEDLRSVGAAEADITGLVGLISLIDDGNWSTEPLRAFAAGRSARPFWK